ncbi:MAG: group 1 glycosyl transferase [Parcubacteria group bacterium Gr01-1014_38]|nr:MAG: group 1 glycosyl transferase [Parcubacteria group bacterium Gr01-1014_38]
MRQNPRVVILIDTLVAGGAQEYIAQLGRCLVSRGVRIAVVALHAGGAYETMLPECGLRVVTLSPRRSLLRVFPVLLRLCLLLRREQPDIVHAFLPVSFLLGTLGARLARVPFVHTIVATRAQSASWYLRALVLLQRWVTLYLTFSPWELEGTGIASRKVKAVEIVGDLAPMFALRRDPEFTLPPFDLAGAYPVALSIGRLHVDKGHQYAIQAWQHVLAEWPHARLLLVGEGPEERRLRSLVRACRVGHAVLFAGYRRDLDRLFRRADLVLRTSVNEGINMTVIHALAAGLPLVGFRVDMRKEVLRDGVNGLLVPPRDVRALGSAIRRLCADRAQMERIGRAGRDGIRRYFDLDAVVSFHERLYTAAKQRLDLESVRDMSETMQRFPQLVVGSASSAPSRTSPR